MPASAPTQGLHRTRRITRRTELERIRQKGKRVRTSSIEVRALASLCAFARAGFIIPKYRQTGVARNKLKRRLKELTRVELLPVLPSIDIVLRVTPATYKRSFEELRVEIRRLLPLLAQLTLPDPDVT